MSRFDVALSEVEAAYDASAPRYDRRPWQALWRRWEFPLVRSLLARAFKRPALLDLGCGTGALAAALGGQCSRYLGVDLSGGMLEVARARRIGGATFIQGDMLAAGGMGFDAVVSLRALNHCPDPVSLISRARSALNPGGLLVLSDVACEHRYEATRLPGATGKRSAPTFKHSADRMAGMLTPRYGFALESIMNLAYQGRDDRPAGACRSVDVSGGVPFGRLYVARAVPLGSNS